MGSPCFNRVPDIALGDIPMVACTQLFFSEEYISDFEIPDVWGEKIRVRFNKCTKLIDDTDVHWFHALAAETVPVYRGAQNVIEYLP